MKTVTEDKMGVLVSSTTFVWNIYLSKNNSTMYDRKI